ncbi:DnaJ-domain-containing protein [Peniophora sp. CONT]|nr:DnaJ-domain-containing protein [Peniophora sp. CONT]
MSGKEEVEGNAYELLGVAPEANDGDIRTAYRQRSLKVHPDRNRGNPDAAQKFHELNQAYELLLDPLRRMALDARLRTAAAKKARFAQYDNKRKRMIEELEEREAAFKRAKTAERAQAQEEERVKDEGRRMMAERAKKAQAEEEEREREEERKRKELEPPPLGELDTTVRVKYALADHPDLTTPVALAAFLAERFGETDSSSIVLTMKAPKKAPQKPPKHAVALVPFRRIGDAHAAVCAAGVESRGMAGVEVTWAPSGSEPPILGWLRRMGKLGTAGAEAEDETGSSTPNTDASMAEKVLPQHSAPASGTFSSFPSTFSDISTSSATPAPAGLDYQAMTMMRLRQAERQRLEREILEQEANEA